MKKTKISFKRPSQEALKIQRLFNFLDFLSFGVMVSLCAAVTSKLLDHFRDKIEDLQDRMGLTENEPLQFADMDPRCTVRGLLTSGEEQISRSLFGDKIDEKRIRIQFCEESVGNEVAASMHLPGVIGDAHYSKRKRIAHDIRFFGKSYQVADYSENASSYNPSHFVPELTHLYQGGKTNVPEWKKDYDYELTPTTKFSDLWDEAQARTVEDYFIRFHRSREITPLNEYYQTQHAKSRYEWLQKMVETELPEASNWRLQLEKTGICAPPRQLTVGEKRLAQGLFGHELNDKNVQVQFCQKVESESMVPAREKTILLRFNGLATPDFSKAPLAVYGDFVENLTTAQAHNNIPCSAHEFPDLNKPNLKALCPKDQGRVVGIFARRFLRSEPERKFDMPPYFAQDTLHRETSLRNLVWRSLPGAKDLYCKTNVGRKLSVCRK